MKKSELKNILKPLIKECVKEVIFEDGILSGIVSEVARGMSGPQIVETQQPKRQNLQEDKFAEMRRKSLEEQKSKVENTRKQLLDSIGRGTYNGADLFEGTTPLSSAPTAPGAGPQPPGALSGVDPGDPGIDISGLLNLSGAKWKAHTNGK